MMQSAQARGRDYRGFRGRLLFCRPAIGRVFVEAIVNSVFVMVVYVIADQSAEMWFVQRDDVVKDLSPTTSDAVSSKNSICLNPIMVAG
jgi:hypothetical protein